MLANPIIVNRVVHEISDFVFYDNNEPYDSSNKIIIIEEGFINQQHKVMLKGSINRLYCLLCMLFGCITIPYFTYESIWISAIEYNNNNKENNKRKEQHDGDDDDDKDNNSNEMILRRFRYSYYCGLLQVDTRHIMMMKVQKEKKRRRDNNNNTTSTATTTTTTTTTNKFRLVEYMDISIWAWIIGSIFYLIFICAVVKLLKLAGYFVDVPLPTALMYICIPLTILYFLYTNQFR